MLQSMRHGPCAMTYASVAMRHVMPATLHVPHAVSYMRHGHSRRSMLLFTGTWRSAMKIRMDAIWSSTHASTAACPFDTRSDTHPQPQSHHANSHHVHEHLQPTNIRHHSPPPITAHHLRPTQRRRHQPPPPAPPAINATITNTTAVPVDRFGPNAPAAVIGGGVNMRPCHGQVHEAMPWPGT